MYIDPISDLITKINNARKAKLPEVTIATSKMCTSILEVLKQEGYIEDYLVSKAKKSANKQTVIKLKYKNFVSSITGMKQISKPGLIIYQESKKIPKVLNGLGIAIVSTN
ncbi:MAG: 30S ribosomal protein S8, partial [Mycoplasmoidaceae bacterium]|nr:30S ribosomal protein S8 [Mycoplasmoidaceae bacterium]